MGKTKRGENMSLFQADKLIQIGKLDPMVHVPARLMIIKLLSEVISLDCVRLSEITELSWGNLSSHLAKLEASGLITQIKTWQGKKPNTIVQLTDAGHLAYQDWARTILSALPSQMNPELLFQAQMEQGSGTRDVYDPGTEDVCSPMEQLRELPLPGIPQVLWFIPPHHRWDRILPPLGSINQVF